MNEVLNEEETRAFWRELKTLLDDRAHDLAAGPRNVVQLADSMGVARGTLAWQMGKAKSLHVRGAGVTVETVAGGLDWPGWPMTVEGLLLNAGIGN